VKIFLVILTAVACYSCNSSTSAISEHLKNADSVVINLRSTSTTDTATKMFNTKDKKALQKLTHYLNGKTANNYQCNYDGKMIFYAGQQELQTVDFNYSNSQCRHFTYTIKGEAMEVRMNDEGADFFNALATGADHF
jgi:hypothetical protein